MATCRQGIIYSLLPCTSLTAPVYAQARNLCTAAQGGCSPYVKLAWGRGGDGAMPAFKTPRMDNTLNPRWNYTREFRYSCRLNDLRSRTLELEVR